MARKSKNIEKTSNDIISYPDGYSHIDNFIRNDNYIEPHGPDTPIIPLYSAIDSSRRVSVPLPIKDIPKRMSKSTENLANSSEKVAIDSTRQNTNLKNALNILSQMGIDANMQDLTKLLNIASLSKKLNQELLTPTELEDVFKSLKIPNELKQSKLANILNRLKSSYTHLKNSDDIISKNKKLKEDNIYTSSYGKSSYGKQKKEKSNLKIMHTNKSKNKGLEK